MKNSKKGLIVLVVLVIAALVSAGAKLAKPSSSVVTSIKNHSKQYIAVLNVRGVIQERGLEYNQHWILSTIETLKKDSKNAGILLFIDSPGGTVYHSDETYLALLNYKASGKKVYAYFGSMAASGGYYIGCSAEKIFANRNCLTGSIGVISGSAVDATELLEKMGIKSYTIHTGRNKNMLNFNEKATDEQIEIMQSLADEAYEQFTSIVALSRHMNIEEVKKIADGRIYSALQAQKNGLVDEVMTFEQAIEQIKKEMELPELDFKGYKYEKPDNLRSLLMESFSLIKNPQSAFVPGNNLSYLYR